MIVPMQKVFIAAARRDRDALLGALRDLGAVHLQPVDPERAVPDEPTATQLDLLGRACQILGSLEPTGSAPQLEPLDAAREVQTIQRRSAEAQSRLTALYRQLQQVQAWGDLQLGQLDALAEAGLEVRFASVPAEAVDTLDAELVEVLGEQPGKTVLIGLVRRPSGDAEDWSLPDECEWLHRPERDAPDLRAEAEQIDKQLSEDNRRLAVLANLLPQLHDAHIRAQQQADWVVAHRGGLEEDHLFALQGWVPADQAETLAGDLKSRGVDAAVQAMQPEPDEQPPTLVRYPRWAKPIKALFDILGTVPGYRELDLSPFFFFALPIFAAMLIGDAGYGLCFLIVSALAWGKLARKVGTYASAMLLIFALVTLAWGTLSGNFFGVSPHEMLQAGGFWAQLGGVLQPMALLWRADSTAGRNLIIQISFLFGTIHLVLAHLRAALGKAPAIGAVAELGWSAFLVGMLGVVWSMFFPQSPLLPGGAVLVLMGGGAAGIVLCSYPSRNPLKWLGLGVVGNLMPMISAFSDTISYIRLMAVGLASYYIAVAFNGLGMKIAEGGPALYVPAGLIILFAHALNIALGLIAIFAHGVRLNMLEFSSNAGVQWSGYPYAPFALQTTGTEGE